MGVINAMGPYPDFPEGKEKFVLDAIDKIILLAPSFESFEIHRIAKNLDNWRDVSFVLQDIKHTLRVLNYTLGDPSQSFLRLSELGREVKAAGGYYSYLEQKKLEQERILEKERFELEVLKTTVAQNKYLWSTRWLNYFLSGLAIIISIIAIIVQRNAEETSASDKSNLESVKNLKPAK